MSTAGKEVQFQYSFNFSNLKTKSEIFKPTSTCLQVLFSYYLFLFYIFLHSSYRKKSNVIVFGSRRNVFISERFDNRNTMKNKLGKIKRMNR